MNIYLEKAINLGAICYLGSVDKEGYPIVRAMLKPIQVKGNCIYLHTNTTSNKIRQFLENPKASLYFCDSNKFEGITLLGEIEVIRDEIEKANYWKDEYKLYYAEDIGMEDFSPLRFRAKRGEHYYGFKVTEFEIMAD